MTKTGKDKGARDFGVEARAPGDASPDAGKKKGRKPISRDDDPPVVAASQEKAPPMSTKAPAKTPSSASAKSAAPDSLEDPLYSFVKSLKPQIPQRADSSSTQTESPFSQRKPLLPDTGPKDPVAEAAHLAGAGLKALASWRVVEPRTDPAAGEPDPIWDNLKSWLTWRKPAPKKKETKTWTGGYQPEPEFKVDLLVSAITRSHPDRRR